MFDNNIEKQGTANIQSAHPDGKQMLGHKKIQTTQIYAKVLDTKVSLDMQLLEKKLQIVTVEKNDDERHRVSD